MEPDAFGRLSAPPNAQRAWVSPEARERPEKGALETGGLANAAAWLYRLASAARPGHYRAGFYALGTFVVGLFLLINGHGPCLQVEYGHDAIGFLSSAWKVRGGVWPHADYHSALGALNPWILAAGMWALGPTAAVLPFCNSLVAIGLGLLAWAVARTRLPALPALVFAVTQTVVAATPHLLRFDWWAATYDGYYNRQGYALVSILLPLLFLPRLRNSGRRDNRADGHAAGAVLGVLLFLKISYFLVGGGLCVLAIVSGRRHSMAMWRHLLIAFALVAMACLPLIRFDVFAMLSDLRMAAGARTGNPRAVFTPGRYLGWLADCPWEIGLLVAMQLTLIVRDARTMRDGIANAAGRAAPRGTALGGVFAASAFICMTNSAGGDHSETPFLTSWLFVLLGDALRPDPARREGATGEASPGYFPAFCGLACVLWVYTYGAGLTCLAWAHSPWPTPWQRLTLRSDPVIASDSLADLRIPGGGGEPIPMSYAGKINDGLRLLRTLPGPCRVEALDFCDPFPVALRWPVARGGEWCWHNGFSFSAKSHPTPPEAFGETDVLMVPKYPGETESYLVMSAIYGPFVEAHYTLIAESDQWWMMRRR